MVQPELVPVVEKALELLTPEARDRLPPRRILLLCDVKDKPADSPYDSMFERWQKQGVPRQIRSDEEKETAYLCYSSGTTGKAKGVMTSHHNMECQVQALYACFEPTNAETDKILAVLPFSHIYGLTLTLHFPLVRGVPVVLLPKFDPVNVFKAIQKVSPARAKLMSVQNHIHVLRPSHAHFDIEPPRRAQVRPEVAPWYHARRSAMRCQAHRAL